MRTRSLVLAALCMATLVVSACGKTSEGKPVTDDAATVAASTSSADAATTLTTRAIPTPEADLTEPGVVPTTRTEVAPGTVTCAGPEPAQEGVTATVADPAAPKITVLLPQGWATEPGEGDVGTKLTGPEGVWATVTIAKTTLDPAAAFKQYADDAMAASAVSSVSVLPADLCGYSGQKLLGSWAETPEQEVEFGDRVAHVWTNSGDYLVAVHVQGPSGTGFDPFTSPMMDDFAIEIPLMLTELVELAGGSFRMGSTQFYPEEAPVHTATVTAIAIERHPVTNAQFTEFVSATGYLTVAEHGMDPALYPGVSPEDLAPGALVFRPTRGPVDLRDWRQWWTWVPGANWRHPFGPDSSSWNFEDRLDHPVVQVAYPDAAAYASWAGRRLPTEAEWEYAARAGATTTYSWGAEVTPDGRLMANTWQGRFPYFNEGAAGWVGTSPVGTFPANAFGVVDMIGNVWEWTTTEFSAHHRLDGKKGCCTPAKTADPAVNQTLKGGSHLCAPEYCHRYRPAARSPQSQDSATTHIGFRCVADVGRAPAV